MEQDCASGPAAHYLGHPPAAEPVFDSEGNPTGVYKFGASGANKALELIGKRLGMFVEKHEHAVTNVPILAVPVTEPDAWPLATARSAPEGVSPASWSHGASQRRQAGRDGGLLRGRLVDRECYNDREEHGGGSGREGSGDSEGRLIIRHAPLLPEYRSGAYPPSSRRLSLPAMARHPFKVGDPVRVGGSASATKVRPSWMLLFIPGRAGSSR